jgi:phage shock protein A
MRLLHTLKRFWQYLIALLTCRLDRLDDPQTLLLLAQREMQQMHANNRERAVRAITQRNHLRQVIADARRRSDGLLGEANEAARRGEREQADALFQDWEKALTDLAHAEQSLAEVEQTVEDVKAAIRLELEAEQICRKTARSFFLDVDSKRMLASYLVEPPPTSVDRALASVVKALCLIALVLMLVLALLRG